MENEGISIEVIDPRTLKPFDNQTVFDSVKKTGKLIVCDEGWINCGMASEMQQGYPRSVLIGLMLLLSGLLHRTLHVLSALHLKMNIYQAKKR